MKRWQGSLLLLPGMLGAAPLPEHFGVIDISGHRHPQFIYAEPRHGVAGSEAGAPLYLHVPRDHAKQWSRFCGLYDACGRPAWFVSEEWYYGIFLGKAADAAPEDESP